MFIATHYHQKPWGSLSIRSLHVTPHACCIYYPSHPPWFNKPSKIRQRRSSLCKFLLPAVTSSLFDTNIFLTLCSHTFYVFMLPKTENLLSLISLSSEMFFLRQIDVSCSWPPMSKQERNSTNKVFPSSLNATLASKWGFVFTVTESTVATSFLRPFTSLSGACRSEDKVCKKQTIHHDTILQSKPLSICPRVSVQSHYSCINSCQTLQVRTSPLVKMHPIT